jgi:signal recognition particle subunit SRP54
VFDALSDRFDAIFTRLRKRGKLSDKDLDEVAREIRLALLEADVNFQVVKRFIARVKERAADAEIHKSLTPAQQVIKIVHEELVETLGGTSGKLTMSPKPPTVILLAGLQGSGKTTQAGKLARWIKTQGHDVLLVGADLQRPAAVQQLRVLGERIGVTVFSEPSDPVTVARKAMDEAARLGKAVVIVDTAGRLQIDDELMDELREVRDAVQPHNVLLVIDAMTGQEAVNVAEAFHATVPIDGVILTKVDGDARGGAALSVKEVIGKPILFAGVGEKIDEFEPFHPDRMAQRILGMGDVMTLIEKAEEHFDQEQAVKAEAKLRQGKFTLDDFLEQLQQVKKMGSIQSILKMIPGLPKEMRNAEVDDKELKRVEAIIRSMTPSERDNPQIINGSRRLRIAKGSGTTTTDVNKLLKEFKMMQQLMKSAMGRPGKKGRAMPGGLPAGFPGVPGR